MIWGFGITKKIKFPICEFIVYLCLLFKPDGKDIC